MNQWSAKIETRTRDELMEVCDILAKGLSQNVQSGQRFKVIIDGVFSGGKAAIVDGITAALADGMSAKGLVESSLYEDDYSDAQGNTLTKNFNCENRGITNTFYHFHHNDAPLPDPEGGRPSNGGIDFETYLCMLKAPDPCLQIGFQYGSESPQQEWSRAWSIDVSDPALKTAEMAQALQGIRNFHNARQIGLTNDFG